MEVLFIFKRNDDIKKHPGVLFAVGEVIMNKTAIFLFVLFIK